MYGMEKTTVYLPVELKAAIERTARAGGTSEANVIRQAIAAYTVDAAGPTPRVPLFRSTEPDLADRVDAALDGFGER